MEKVVINGVEYTVSAIGVDDVDVSLATTDNTKFAKEVISAAVKVDGKPVINMGLVEYFELLPIALKLNTPQSNDGGND